MHQDQGQEPTVEGKMLTREQVELLFQQIWDLNDQASGEALLDHDAALRQALTQQAQELQRHNNLLQVLHFIVEHDGEFDDLAAVKADAETYGVENVLKLKQQAQEVERVKMEVNNRREEVEKLVLETTHTYTVVIPDMVQQLAAMTTARKEAVKNLHNQCLYETAAESILIQAGIDEYDSTGDAKGLHTLIHELVDKTKALQATLAAREAELHEVKMQCGKNAMLHMAEYHRADAAVHEAWRLREVLEKIAKPALGGKQQQWMAQEALKEQHASGSSGGSANHGAGS